MRCPERSNVALSLIEIITNAIEHGNLGISGTEKSELKSKGDVDYLRELARRAGEAPYENRKVLITANINGNGAIFHVEDEGDGFDFENLPDPTVPENIFLPSGRGILLARTYMDEVEFLGKGNLVRMTKKKSLRN